MAMDELKQMKNEFKSLCKDIDAILKCDLKTFKDIESFEKTLAKLASGADIGQAIDIWKDRTLEMLRNIKGKCREEFGRNVSGFIRAQQEAGIKTREFQDAWRVGPIKIDLKADRASVRFAYNEAPLGGWSVVTSSDDIEKLYIQARKQLDEHAVPEECLVELIEEAVKLTLFRTKSKQLHDSKQVPLKELFVETEVALYRANKVSRGKYKVKELPIWAFLYNVDRYRRVSASLPVEKRLQFDHGSQQEIASGLGVILNGLDAGEDYKTFCFVKSI